MTQVSHEQINVGVDMMEVSEEDFNAEADSVNGLIKVSRGNGLFVFFYPNREPFGKMFGWDRWYLAKKKIQ